jgi:hypothetical protein
MDLLSLANESLILATSMPGSSLSDGSHASNGVTRCRLHDLELSKNGVDVCDGQTKQIHKYHHLLGTELGSPLDKCHKSVNTINEY